jgi:hypothetical protein
MDCFKNPKYILGKDLCLFDPKTYLTGGVALFQIFTPTNGSKESVPHAEMVDLERSGKSKM